MTKIINRWCIQWLTAYPHPLGSQINSIPIWRPPRRVGEAEDKRTQQQEHYRIDLLFDEFVPIQFAKIGQ